MSTMAMTGGTSGLRAVAAGRLTRFGDGVWTVSGNVSWSRRAGPPERKGRNPEASAAIMDSQGVRMAEGSGGNKGNDAGKNVPGRKRHLLVGTSGLPLAGRVTPADTSDSRGARELLAGLAPPMPRPELVWADSACAVEKLRKRCEKGTRWRLKTVSRNTDGPTFGVLPRRRVVERSIARICHDRRLAKDYERSVQTSECWTKMAMIRLMLRRFRRS